MDRESKDFPKCERIELVKPPVGGETGVHARRILDAALKLLLAIVAIISSFDVVSQMFAEYQVEVEMKKLREEVILLQKAVRRIEFRQMRNHPHDFLEGDRGNLNGKLGRSVPKRG